MSYHPSFQVNDLVKVQATAGRISGRWIPGRVTRVHSHIQKLDVCIPNNKAYNVFKYALQVPFKYVRHLKRLYKVGDRVSTKIVRGRQEGIWIPARILRVNMDGTYDLDVEDYKKLEVTRFAMYVPEEYLKPTKKSDNPLKPSIIMPPKSPKGPALDAKDRIKAKEDRLNRKLQERRAESIEKEKVVAIKSRNKRMEDWKSIALRTGIKSEEFFPNLTLEILPPVGMRRHQSTESSFKRGNQSGLGGGAYKMSNTMIHSTPVSPLDNNVSCGACSGELIPCPEESPNGRQYPSFDSQVHIISTDRRRDSVKVCDMQGKQEEPDLEDDAQSAVSDWNDHFEGDFIDEPLLFEDHSDTEERKEDSESVITDEEWGLMHKDEKQNTPRLHHLEYSGVTSPGQSYQSWGYPDLGLAHSEPLTGQSKLSYSKGSRQDGDRPSYDFVDSFLGRKRRGSTGMDRIVTIGVSKHRVQFSEYDFDTPVENIATWLAEGALKCGNKGISSPNMVNNLAFNGKMFPIRNSSTGSIGELECTLEVDDTREYSLRDVLGKSLDASRQGLAFFVGPVNGRMSYKMSVLDVDKIEKARSASKHFEIKEDEELVTPQLSDAGYSGEV